MKESDWKIFKKIKEQAIDTFCKAALEGFRSAMDDDDLGAHNKYLLNYKLVENRNKKMALLFDGHSRSKARLQLVVLRGEGLADVSLVGELSEELQLQTDPISIGR